MFNQLKNMDAREIELPETVFIRDIDSRVLQGIVLHVLSKIENIGLIEGNLIDSLLGRDIDRAKGIHVEQEQKGKSVTVRIEINIVYGVSIPEKSEEIQSKISEEITQWTGLHVSSIHVIFKNLIAPQEKGEESKEEETFELT
ncbi:MAG TPA: Asp23/Gls24 family envelope stress response protein [Chlamydiales bacterium]|nr:Asp23/Gls24 family envelope stress response protein [Chlamydiales bacterium]